MKFVGENLNTKSVSYILYSCSLKVTLYYIFGILVLTITCYVRATMEISCCSVMSAHKNFLILGILDFQIRFA